MVRVPIQLVPQEQRATDAPTMAQSQRTAPVQNFAPMQTAAMGEQVERLGLQQVVLERKAQEELDATETKRQDNIWTQRLQDALRNPKTGYLNTAGKDATGENRTRLFEQLKEERAALEAGLRTDAQRRVFNEVSTARLLGAHGEALTHESREVQTMSLAESDTQMKLAQRDAVNNYGTASFDSYMDLAKQAATDKADTMGLAADSAQRREFQLNATSPIHMGVAQRLYSSGDAAGASAYLAAAKDEMMLDDYARASTNTATAMKQGEAERVARALIVQADDAIYEAVNRATDWNAVRKGEVEAPPPQAQARSAELMTSASKLLDRLQDEGKLPPGLRDDVLRLVKQEADIRKEQFAEKTVQVRTLSRQWLSAPENVFKSPNDMPPELLRLVREHDLIDETNLFAKNHRVFDDPGAWLAAHQMYESGALAQMSPTMIEDVFGRRLSPERVKAVHAMRADLRKEATDAQQQIISIPKQVKRKAEQLDIIPGPNNPNANRQDSEDATKADEAKFARFEAELQRRISGRAKPATPEEIDQIMGAIAADRANLTQADWVPFIDTAQKLVPVSLLAEGEKAEAYVFVKGEKVLIGAAPTEVADEIVSELQRQGVKDVSRQLMLETWVHLNRPRNAKELQERMR